jgi:steroid delta-isomerase-like uncharacterized protein
MHAGVLKGRIEAGHMDAVLDILRDETMVALGRIPGFRSGFAWVNRQNGDFLNLGMYDSEEARQAAGPVVGDTLSRLMPHLAGPTPERELYELALSTSDESRAVIQRGVDAFNRGDLEQIARDCAADVVFTAPGGMEYRGPQAVKEFNQTWRTAFPDARVDVDSIVARGTTVVVQGRFSGTHSGTLATSMGDIPATGRKVSERFVEVYDLDRGLVSRGQLYFDRMSMMTQLGMMPSDIRTSA